ncbi:MAG: hypothetical protein LBT21_04190, partial [Oscillospiraceae bacterium]|nr:hypothetical protein [Oscillospiraceae bacterium]
MDIFFSREFLIDWFFPRAGAEFIGNFLWLPLAIGLLLIIGVVVFKKVLRKSELKKVAVVSVISTLMVLSFGVFAVWASVGTISDYSIYVDELENPTSSIETQDDEDEYYDDSDSYDENGDYIEPEEPEWMVQIR